MRAQGQDAQPARKLPKKRKANAADDARDRATAREYLVTAIAEVAPRVDALYSGLVPWDAARDSSGASPTLTDEQKRQQWIADTFLEMALLDELEGSLDAAKRSLATAAYVRALLDPTHRWEKDLADAMARLGVTNASPRA